MPITDGNDTIDGSRFKTDMDGLGGDDLLILNYAKGYLGYEVTRVLIGDFDGLRGTVYHDVPRPAYPGYPWPAQYLFKIANIEHFNIIGTSLGFNTITVKDGNDTLRGGEMLDVFDVGRGANVVYGNN